MVIKNTPLGAYNFLFVMIILQYTINLKKNEFKGGKNMHMADALLAPTVAATMYVASGITTGISIHKLKIDEQKDKLPMMGVMAAFVFAGQMINYTIPGTGSSGHLCGGMIISALLGPYAGFLSMVVILTIQSLFFADGGLLALGANVWNMAFYGCFIGYFLIYRPILKCKMKNIRIKIVVASILSCILTLQLGAFSVCIETMASGITELPIGAFLTLMQPIHLAIGLVEGLITSAVLVFLYEVRPELLECVGKDTIGKSRFNLKKVLLTLVIAVILIGGIGSQFASSNPDGLEWSLFGNQEKGYSTNMNLNEDEYGITSKVADIAESVQNKTAFLPDYAFRNEPENSVGTSFSGVVGSAIVALLALGICFSGSVLRKCQKR